MRKYFKHLGMIILIKVAVVTLMSNYLFPKNLRIKPNASLVQHQFLD